MQDSLDHTIAEWKLRNGILIFWNHDLSNEVEYMYMYDLKIIQSGEQKSKNICVFFILWK